METPILETERMILRTLSLSDVRDIYERWATDEHVARYVRWSVHSSIEVTEEWIKAEEKNISSDKSYQWGFTLKEDGFLFGSGGLHYNEDEGVWELGYNIMHKFWNQGYVTEAARAIIGFATEQLGIKEFIAWHAVENPASGAVLRKCGFVYEKNEKHTKFDGVTSFETMKYRLVIE